MKNGYSKMVRKESKMEEKEKSELSPKAAKELRKTLVRFSFVMECYKDVYHYAEAKPEDKAAVIMAAADELKKLECYFLTMNEMKEIAPEDRISMTKFLRVEFYEFVKDYV